MEGVSDAKGISNVFSDRFSRILNSQVKEKGISSTVCGDVSSISVSADTVVEAFGKLKSHLIQDGSTCSGVLFEFSFHDHVATLLPTAVPPRLHSGSSPQTWQGPY